VRASILDHQLNMATDIQEQMLPKGPPTIAGYDIYGRSQPAKEVGGDLFDFLPCPDNRLYVAIADVSGKSIPASLLMTMTRALIAAAVESAEGPDEVLKNVNTNLARRFAQGRFVTASLVSINGRRTEYASAGHQPLLIYRAECDDFREVDADGIAMGIIEDVEFERIQFELSEGSTALMFTDGLTDAINPEGQRFGMEGVREVLRRHARDGAKELVDALFQAIQDHAVGAAQYDDTTIVAIKRVAGEEP
jgi:sigma-B regulation protein RsbU (phosphoserine phosphatase)